jgi:hypothetical protein
MSNIYLATYSSGGPEWAATRKRLAEQAAKTQWFNGIISADETFLDIDFRTRYANILCASKGAGYWVWKPYIVRQCLDFMERGDILFYIDAGCTINAHGMARFRDYLDIIRDGESGSLAFQMSQIEKWWTTRQIFDYFSIDRSSSIANTGQLIGGIFGLQKRYNTEVLIREILHVLVSDPLLFTDEYSQTGQLECFKQNRHDQSIFSIARKIMGTSSLTDETSSLVYGDGFSRQFPFWATRIKPTNPAYKVLSEDWRWDKRVMPSSDLVYGLNNINQALNPLGLGIGRTSTVQTDGKEMQKG